MLNYCPLSDARLFKSFFVFYVNKFNMSAVVCYFIVCLLLILGVCTVEKY